MASKVLFQSFPLFEKRTVVELTENELLGIDGGSTPTCVVTRIVVSPSQVWQGGVAVGQWLYSVTH